MRVEPGVDGRGNALRAADDTRLTVAGPGAWNQGQHFTTELNGRIDMRPLAADDASSVGIATTPVRGTVVELAVPLSED